MATWKKLATYDATGKVEGNITGTAIGLDSVLPINKGGTGQSSLSEGTTGALLMWGSSGLQWSEAPDGGGKFLASTASGQWDWLDIASSHRHEGQYIPTATASGDETTDFTGSMLIGGSLEVQGSVTMATFNEISQVSSANGVLDNGASDDGNNSGWFIDEDPSDSSNTITSGDPCILWDSSYMGTSEGGWTVGLYSTDMRGLVMSMQTDISPASTPSHPGCFGKDASGNIYFSVA